MKPDVKRQDFHTRFQIVSHQFLLFQASFSIHIELLTKPSELTFFLVQTTRFPTITLILTFMLNSRKLCRNVASKFPFKFPSDPAEDTNGNTLIPLTLPQGEENQETQSQEKLNTGEGKLTVLPSSLKFPGSTSLPPSHCYGCMQTRCMYFSTSLERLQKQHFTSKLCCPRHHPQSLWSCHLQQSTPAPSAITPWDDRTHVDVRYLS